LLKQRIATAVVLIPLALVAIFLLPLSWFAIAVMGVMTLAAWEWSPIMGFRTISARLTYAAVILLITAGLYLMTPLHAIWAESGMPAGIFYPLIIGGAWWLVSLVLVLGFPGSQCMWAKTRSIVAVIGVLMLVPAWAGLVALRALNYDVNPLYGSFAVLFVFLLVWAADVGAYFTGKRWGRTKLMPDVSPNKTLEGLAGGVVLAILVMLVVAALIPVPRELWLNYLIVGIAVVLFSALGDLNESMFKRCAGIKDSGSILPGHGGILDRIDSLTSAVPIFALGYLWLLHS